MQRMATVQADKISCEQSEACRCAINARHFRVDASFIPASRRPTAAGTEVPVLCVVGAMGEHPAVSINLVAPSALNSALPSAIPGASCHLVLQLARIAKGWLADSCRRASMH